MKIIDEEIEKIRAVREKISAAFGHDPRKMVAYYSKTVSPRKPSKIRARKKVTVSNLASKR